MATECPDCGKTFRGAKCSCGYTPSSPANKAEAERRWHELRKAAAQEADVMEMRWKAKLDVLGNVRVSGKRRWAYEVIALHEAGMYGDHRGLLMAREAIKQWETPNKTER